MSTQLDISGPIKPLARFMQRFHITLFILFIATGLALAVGLLYTILNDATYNSDYVSPITAGSIDQTTLDRINALHPSSGPYPAAPTSDARSNPFTE